jgi:hypothetical protein
MSFKQLSGSQRKFREGVGGIPQASIIHLGIPLRRCGVRVPEQLADDVQTYS